MIYTEHIYQSAKRIISQERLFHVVVGAFRQYSQDMPYHLQL